MPLDTNVQAEMYQAGMFLPSNNGFMRLVYRLLYLCAVVFILSDFASDWYVAGTFSFDDKFMSYVFLTEI